MEDNFYKHESINNFSIIIKSLFENSNEVSADTGTEGYLYLKIKKKKLSDIMAFENTLLDYNIKKGKLIMLHEFMLAKNYKEVRKIINQELKTK